MSKTEFKEHFDRVAEGETFASYEERRWKANPRMQLQHLVTREFIERKVLSQVASAKHIVEVGAGPGTWTMLLAEAAPQARFTLVDISPEMLKRAQSALPNRNVEIREGDFSSISIEEGEADFFFSSRAVEYMEDKKRVAEQIAHLLASGGKGVIITKMPKRLANTLTGRTQSELHSMQINGRDLTNLLKSVGLTNVRAYPVTLAAPLFRSALADRIAHSLLVKLPLNAFSAFIAESYALSFEKP